MTTIAPSVATTVKKKSGCCPWFDEDAHNEKYDIHPESTTRCRSWEDLARRESYDECFVKEGTANVVREYDMGMYGSLRCALIGDEAWCSLNDAGRIAGVPIHSVTGWLGDWDVVRGQPGYLTPDGIRYLGAQGTRVWEFPYVTRSNPEPS